MAGGTMTRKDLITDEALEFGKEYAKNIRIAIEANDDLVESAKAILVIAGQYQKIMSNSNFITLKQQEALETTKAMNAIKLETEALKAAEKAKQESLRTRKLELDAINKEEAAKKRNTALTIEERVQNEINNRVLKQAALEKLGLVSAYDKLNRSRTEAKNKLRDLIASETSSTAEIKKAQIEFEKLDAKVKKADKAVGDFTKNVGNYPQLAKFTGILTDLSAAFGLTVGIAAFANAMNGAYQKIKQFDQSVADLKAITGATGKDLDYLKKQAIDLGKETAGGAVKVVESYKLIASAKPELLDNVKALNEVTKATLTLSKASGEGLPEAATALTDAMNQFNAPAEKAGEFIDALANGAKYGSAEIPQVTESLLKFGAVAKSSNINIQESTALIELLADRGLKGAEAGTALRNVLLKISSPDVLPKEAQKIFSDLGISMVKLKDNTIPIQEKLEMLSPILKDNSSLVKIFGVENAVAARNILSNTDRLKELTSKMYEYGTAQQQAQERSDTLQGKTERLSATYDSFILSLNEGSGVVSDFFKFFIDGAKGALDGLIRLNTGWDDLYEKAKNEGIEKGKESFSDQFQGLVGTGSEAEIAAAIRTGARKDYLIYKKKLDELQKEIDKDVKEFNERSSLSQFIIGGDGVSGPTKRKKEELLKDLAEQEAIIKQANTLIFNSQKTNSEKQLTQQKQVDKLTEEQIKKRNDDAVKKAEKARADYLSKLKKQEDDAYSLQKFRLDRSAELNDEITADENESIQDRIDAYLESERLKLSSLNLTLEHELVSNALSLIDAKTTSIKKMKSIESEAKLKAKQLSDGVVLSENASNAEKLIYEKYLGEKEDLGKKEIADKQKIIDSIVEIEQKKTDKILQQQDTKLNERLLEENKLYEKEIALLEGNQQAIEDATIAHEARILKIKEDSAKKALQTQIDVQKELLKNSELSADKKADIENKLSKLELELNQIGVDSKQKANQEKADLEEAYSEKIKELQKELQDALIDFTNSLFSNKIATIDAELQANEDYYARQIELAGNDDAQKTLLEQEREKKREALEKKKKKAEFQAALFNKIVTLATIASQTAMASVAALAPPPVGLGPVLGPSLLPYIITTGAIQASIVAATPLPKYEKGTQGKPHKGGFAEVAEKRPEVILEPGRNPYVVEKPSILNLPKGTEVIPSLKEWEMLQRAAIMSSLDMEANKAKNYQGAEAFNARYDAELLEELRRNTEATKKNKSNVVVQNNIDLGHEIWKLSNIKWGA